MSLYCCTDQLRTVQPGKSAILLVFAALSAFAFADDRLDSILAGVLRRQQEMADAIEDAQFTADYVYTETDQSGREKTVEAVRQVFMKGFSRQKHVFQSMRLDGRELTGIEMQRELIPWRMQEALIARTRMPFALDERRHYRFHLAGEETLDGRPAWCIGFEPARRAFGFLEGTALVDQADSSVLQLRFMPVVRPGVIEQMSIVLDYAEMQGFRLPARFDMDAEVRVAFITTLFHKRIRIQERYSDYLFNSGLSDDLFH